MSDEEEDVAVAVLVAIPMLSTGTWDEVFGSLKDMVEQLTKQGHPSANQPIGTAGGKAPQGVVLLERREHDPDPAMLPFVFTVANLDEENNPLLRNFGRLINDAEAEVAREQSLLGPRDGGDNDGNGEADQ